MSDAKTLTLLKTLFEFPFQGPKWQSRFVVGSVLILAGFLIPIVPGIFVYGYVLRVMRQALEGEDLTLPAWEDWGGLAMDGLRGMVVSLVYFLPGMAFSFGGMALYFASSFSFPLLMNSANGESEAALALPLLFLVSMVVMFLSMAIGLVLSLLGALPLPVATAHFVLRDKVRAAFCVREWWPLLRANKLGYFIAWVIVTGLGGILYLALIMIYYTFVLCCFIPFLAAPFGFYVSLVGAALFGQTYRESVAILSPQEPVTLD